MYKRTFGTSHSHNSLIRDIEILKKTRNWLEYHLQGASTSAIQSK